MHWALLLYKQVRHFEAVSHCKQVAGVVAKKNWLLKHEEQVDGVAPHVLHKELQASHTKLADNE